MLVCPSCPEIDDYGRPADAHPSRDQRPWVQDGRCHACHDRLQDERAKRLEQKRASRAWRIKVQFNASTYNWSRI